MVALTPAAASQENEAAVYGSRGAKSTPCGRNRPSQQGDPDDPESTPRIARRTRVYLMRGERSTADGPGRSPRFRGRRRQALAAARPAARGGTRGLPLGRASLCQLPRAGGASRMAALAGGQARVLGAAGV